MQGMANVESFDLDHTKVKAPYVRLAGLKRTPHGDAISKYDLRLLQPNAGAIDPAAIHTLEHLLAGYLRDHLQDVVDVSPMGCRTGMYMAVIGEPNEAGVLEAFKSALSDVAAHDQPIPGVSELEVRQLPRPRSGRRPPARPRGAGRRPPGAADAY